MCPIRILKEQLEDWETRPIIPKTLTVPKKKRSGENLGPANLDSTNVLPPLTIKVKRQDSTQHEVNLMDELCDFT